MVETAPATTQLELMTAYGPTFRTVSTAAPRDSLPGEIPVIDLAHLFDGPEARQALAAQIKKAAEKIGFFYIQNHGVKEDVINKAEEQALKYDSPGKLRFDAYSKQILPSVEGRQGQSGEEQIEVL